MSAGIKDEIENEEYLNDDDGIRYIGLEEAKEYMDYLGDRWYIIFGDQDGIKSSCE